MAGLREFVVRHGIEEQCVEHSAGLRAAFHRTRTELTKWFLTAYLMGRDKRGVSASFCNGNSAWRIRRSGPWRTSCGMG